MDSLIRHRLGRSARALTYAAVAGIPIAVLAFLIRAQFDPLVRADDRVIAAATSFTAGNEDFWELLGDWEWISQPWVMYLCVGAPVVAFLWVRHGLVTRAWWALVTMAVGWILSALVKQIVGRARPVVEDPVSHPHGFSFPSGHATNNTVLWAVVIVALWPLLGVAARRIAVTVGVTWVLLTCADRVFLGAHFVSDVVSGVLMGCGLVAASYAGFSGWTPAGPEAKADQKSDHATAEETRID